MASVRLMIPKSVNFNSSFSPNLKIQELMNILTCPTGMWIIFLSEPALFAMLPTSCMATVHMVPRSESTSCQSDSLRRPISLMDTATLLPQFLSFYSLLVSLSPFSLSYNPSFTWVNKCCNISFKIKMCL